MRAFRTLRGARNYNKANDRTDKGNTVLTITADRGCLYVPVPADIPVYVSLARTHNGSAVCREHTLNLPRFSAAPLADSPLDGRVTLEQYRAVHALLRVGQRIEAMKYLRSALGGPSQASLPDISRYVNTLLRTGDQS